MVAVLIAAFAVRRKRDRARRELTTRVTH